MSKSDRVKAYFKNPALSQSEIKAILKGPHLVKIVENNPNYFEESEAMLIGSLVDDMFTYDLPELMEHYHVGGIEKKPSDTMVSIIRKVYDYRISDILSDNVENILIFAREHGYGNGGYKDDRIVNDVMKNLEYWNELLLIGNKTLVSTNEYNLACKINNSIREHEYTKEIFDNPHKFQVDLYFKTDEFECKALLDLLVYDPKRNAICPFDFKITGYNTLFNIPFNKFKYGVQAEWYTNAIYANRDHIANLFGIPNTFTVDDFKFIVESYSNPGMPLIYELKLETIVDAQLMIKEGLDLYKWHKTNDIWHTSKDIYNSKGRLSI